ncbi:hypothetical protein MAP00_003625 [Monascus purpureus]|nr:hypothetical protein MAP00_003625 [Monascus purpureus]
MGGWREKFENSLKRLRESGFEGAEEYTWDLYLWALTIITSRAFSAKVLSGVIADSELPETKVSVLLPLIDLPNHRPLAKVEWRAGEADVGFVVLEDVIPGQEIANNYGPRNNEQLMMNYGFCLPDNSCDYRIVSLRTPPGSPLHEAKIQQFQMYPELSKDAEDHYYVFNIFYPHLPRESCMENTIFSPALFNAVSVLAANGRELETLEISEQGIRIPDAYGNSRNVLAAVSQILIELFTHIVKLKASGQGQQHPANLKQTNAKVYRESQIMLSETALIIAAWTLARARQHGLNDSWEQTKELLNSHISRVPAGKFPEEVTSRIKVRILERRSLLEHGGELFEFGDLFGLLPAEIQEGCRTCLRNISVHAENAIPVLKANPEVSPFAFPLFLCLVTASYRAKASSPEQLRLSPRLEKWAGFLLDKYPPPPGDMAWMLEDEDDEALVSSFDDCLKTVRDRNPDFFSGLAKFTGPQQGDNWWLSPNWIRWAWMVVEQESVQAPDDPMKLLAVDGVGRDAVMLSTVTYLYVPQHADG